MAAKILFQLSGSIACYKACDLLSRLVKAGHDVEVVATPSALKFVGEATLEGLAGRPVHTETFARGGHMDHIRLARWADLILLCPASANTISKMASGLADDLVTTLFLAHDFTKPYLIAPAMNQAMLKHPATAASLAKLGEWGVDVLETGEGNLACGETGEGRLLEPEKLLAIVEGKLATPAASRSREILVTAGGTREPIDRVRSIANSSTGRTGAHIAEYLAVRGHRVTLLRAVDAAKPTLPVARNGGSLEERTFATFDDLKALLEKELGGKIYDAVVHAAAVSDFAIDEIEIEGRPVKAAAKIESEAPPTLRLRRNPKLVDSLRALSRNPAVKIVAFKLTDGASPEQRLAEVVKLARRARPDFIVHNDFSEIAGAKHPATLFAVRGPSAVDSIARAGDKSQIAKELEAIL